MTGHGSRRTAAALLACIAFVAGCGDDSDDPTTSSTTAQSTSTTTTSTETSTTPSGGEAAPPAGTVQLYFTAGEQFEKVDRRIADNGDQLQATAEALIDGPTAADASKGVKPQTAIPSSTTVDGVALDDDGTATVSVSADFMDGIPADPADRAREQRAELAARLGQVTYTLTQLDDVEAAKVVAGDDVVVPDESQAAVERADYAKPSGGPGWKAKPKGEKGLNTREIQQRLAQLNYLPPGAVDGKDGYRTQQAVIAFQSWEGLGRDGVVGPMTTAALKSGEGTETERAGSIEANRGLPGEGRGVADRPRQSSPRDSRVDRCARHGDSVRDLQHLPQGAAVLVDSLPGLAALRVLLQQRDRLPRIPRRAHVPRLSRLCPGAGARGARALQVREARDDRNRLLALRAKDRVELHLERRVVQLGGNA